MGILKWVFEKKYINYTLLEWIGFTVGMFVILIGFAFLGMFGDMGYKALVGETIEVSVTEQVHDRYMTTNELIYRFFMWLIMGLIVVFSGCLLIKLVIDNRKKPWFCLNYREASILLFPSMLGIALEDLDDKMRKTVEELVEKADEFERDFPELAKKAQKEYEKV